KSLAKKRLPKPKSILQELNLDVDAQTFIKVVSSEESDDEATPVWSALVGWEVIPTPIGDINALYRIDQSTKHFTTLRQILHMMDRQDLVKLYGLVVQYYETHPITGVGLLLWGDLQVLFYSHEGVKMVINSPWIMPILGTKEFASPQQTASGKDISNPFMAVMIYQKSLGYSHSLMIHVLRVGPVINSPGYVVPTGRVVVPTGRYVVLVGNVIIVSAGRLSVIPAGRVLSPGRIQIVVPG
nr:hypothetical protein [Tanacetum cinerariifolium]